ncbi:hypothetical protein CDD81_7539 [Ophiocordyceps australis]|uniref:Branched-chain-amino-acid aminotransferase n=1 Tax=Ophiocordyceps australis TaxID=1399860 RepID=A0A2C5XGT5_9HYPO|nr:hypothetical protein CDD81_7539 [Ophiocordyceps australis]
MAPSAISTTPDTPRALSAVLQRKEPIPTATVCTEAGTAPGQSPLDASLLQYTFTSDPRPVPDEIVAVSGDESVATDHMITANWSEARGWEAPELRPYGPLSLMPTASCLHYATECFEGLKVYRGDDGKARLFRPDRNAKRLRMSSARISLPVFEPVQLERLMSALLAVDCPKWLPRNKPGRYLYLRPTIIGTQPQLGVQASRHAMLFIIVTFLPRLDSPPGGLRLLTSPDDMIRSWVGGFGYAKVGANYGPTLALTRDARRLGYHQILWLYGPDGQCTEAGASNLFIVWRRHDGRREIVTAPLDDKLILDGITRRSCVEMARQRLPEVDMTERTYTMDEVFAADADGRIEEAFASGTAYFVCPVSLIHHRGRDVKISMGPSDQGGEVTLKIKSLISDIMWGREKHPWGVVIPETE